MLWIIVIGFVAGIVSRLYRADQGAGFIGAVVGAVVVLFIRNRIAASRGGLT